MSSKPVPGRTSTDPTKSTHIERIAARVAARTAVRAEPAQSDKDSSLAFNEAFGYRKEILPGREPIIWYKNVELVPKEPHDSAPPSDYDYATFQGSRKRKIENAELGDIDNSKGEKTKLKKLRKGPKTSTLSSSMGAKAVGTKFKGFLDLPDDIREAIYRLVFVSKDQINLSKRERLDRTAALLRTCRQVYDEACPILYGENVFEFNRVHSCRGTYYEKDWAEIGFKDMRLFLTRIGERNINYLQYLYICCENALPSNRRELPSDLRYKLKYTYDTVLQECLRMISKATGLRKVVIALPNGGNGIPCLSHRDFHFLEAVAAIRASKVVFVNDRMSKKTKEVVNKLTALMTVPKEEDLGGMKSIRAWNPGTYRTVVF
ncbi:MAG: hypothetical protein Q9227_006249 [Pyrenula ochraceoflavens]